ncbi:hypothetical protein NS365_05500 [Aureimonas ureilytica]|uniref:DUF4238 domain-containing protein n=2 Tax=Aureimonas ureilytica TaxID=401562 RepID=A0A175RT25_9HYPH|nr:hypothetical protein NS365_05500 [Aureimonas ureilytica]
MKGAPTGSSFEDIFFKPIDGLASVTLDIMERHGAQYPYMMEHRRAWSTFVVSLLTRCPEDIQTFRRHWHAVVMSNSPDNHEEYARLRRDGDPDSLDEYMQRLPPEMVESSMFETLTDIISSQPIGQDLSSLNWTILTAPVGARELLTSDRPILWSDDFGSARGHMIMPIGPRKLLIAARDPMFATRLRDSCGVEELIGLCNIDIVQGAAKFVYATNRNQHRFISNRLGVAPAVRHMDRAINARIHRRADPQAPAGS